MTVSFKLELPFDSVTKKKAVASFSFFIPPASSYVHCEIVGIPFYVTSLSQRGSISDLNIKSHNSKC
jgi:hypothetical protein